MMMQKSVKSSKKIDHQKELLIERLLFFYAQRNFFGSEYFSSIKQKLNDMHEKNCFSEKFIEDGQLDFDSLTLLTENILKFKNKDDLKFLLSDEYKENEKLLNSLFAMIEISKYFNYTIFSFFSPTHDIKKHYLLCIGRESDISIDEIALSKTECKDSGVWCFFEINKPPVSILPVACFFKHEYNQSDDVAISIYRNDRSINIPINHYELNPLTFCTLMKRVELCTRYMLIDSLHIYCIQSFNCFFDEIGDYEQKISQEFSQLDMLIDLYSKYKKTSYADVCKASFRKIQSTLEAIQEHRAQIERITQDYKDMNYLMRNSYIERIAGLVLFDISNNYLKISRNDEDDNLIHETLKCYSKQRSEHLKKNAALCVRFIQLFPISA